MRLGVAALFAVSLMAGACGGVEASQGPSGTDAGATYGIVRTPEQAAREGTAAWDCAPRPGEDADPLPPRRVSHVLRRHGFRVYHDEDIDACEGPVVADLWTRNSGAGCTVYPAAHWGVRIEKDLDAPAASPIFSGRKAQFWFANVDCTIYPAGKSTETPIRRFEDAMEDLARLAKRG